MARKRGARVSLTVASIDLPPDTRPVGPLVNDTHPYGQTDNSAGDGMRDCVTGGAIFRSGVMRSRGGKDAEWAHGIRTVSSWELRRGGNPLGPEDEDDYDG